MNLKEEMQAKKEQAAISEAEKQRDISQAAGQQQFDTQVAKSASYLGPALGEVKNTEPPWTKDDDAQLITYMRSSDSIEELLVHYPGRNEWDILGRAEYLVRRRKDFAELKKALK